MLVANDEHTLMQRDGKERGPLTKARKAGATFARGYHLVLVAAALHLAWSTGPARAGGPTCRAPVVVSNFWDRFGVLCSQLERVKSSAAPNQENQQIVAYCTQGVPPAFATRPDLERSATLTRLFSAAGVSDRHPAERTGRWLRSTLADSVIGHRAGNRDLQMGAVGNFVVKQLVGEVCERPRVSTWLPATCGPYDSGQALVELRRRLVHDLLSLPFGYLRANASLPLDSKNGRAMRLTAAVFDTLAESVELAHLAKRMIHDPVIEPDAAQNPCSARAHQSDLLRSRTMALGASQGFQEARHLNAMPVSPGRASQDPVRLAGRVLLRIVQDETLPNQRADYYVKLVEVELGRQLLPAEHPIVAQLVATIREYLVTRQRLEREGPSQQLLNGLADSMIAVVETVASIALRERVALPSAARATLRALAYRDVPSAVVSALRVSQELGYGAAPPEVATGLTLVARVVAARDELSLRRVMKQLVLPFGPWTEPVLFDLNMGAFKLQSGDTRLAGDASVGYDGFDWGTSGRGELGYYYLASQDSRLRSETKKQGGGLDAWANLELDDAWFLELRGGAAIREEQVETWKTEGMAPAFTHAFTTSESTFYRGTLLVGLRYEPGFRAAAGLWLGGGVQRQEFHPFTIEVDSASMTMRSASVSRTTDDRLIGKGRFRFQYAVVPLWLVLRTRADLLAYDIRTTSFTVRLSTSGAPELTNASAESTRQYELATRVFVDLEAARVFKFVPSVWAGMDHVRRDGAGETLSATIPSLGAGMRSDVL
jgi:hypothetical protein